MSSFDFATSSSTRSSSRRHRRRRPRHSSPRPADGFSSALSVGIQLLDALIVAVEETAWSARHLADLARQAYSQGADGWQRGVDDFSVRSEQVVRFTRTGLTLARITGSYRLQRLKRAFMPAARAEADLAELHADNARAFGRMSAEHGGAFVKVGQLLSARADLLPDVWVRELTSLQDALPPVRFDAVQSVVEEELGKGIDELFASFELTPIAAASIGQVHRAVLLDGREVAVKVQRPNIESAVRGDLHLLEVFLRALGKDFGSLDIETCVNAIRDAILRELDYRAEAETTRVVSEFFANDSRICAPMPVLELCTERVLVTELMRGEKITVALDAWEAKRRSGDAFAAEMTSTLLGRLLEAYLRQVLELGTFQADAHPGNLLALEDDRVCILDFGCAEQLAPELRQRYRDLLFYGILGDTARVAELLAVLGFETASGRPDTLHAFADSLLGELRQMNSGAVAWPTSEELSRRAHELLSAYQADPVVRIPAEFVMIGRLFISLSGLFAHYQPQIDFARHVLPVLQSAFEPDAT